MVGRIEKLPTTLTKPKNQPQINYVMCPKTNEELPAKCDDCLQAINEQMNGILGNFEVNSHDVLVSMGVKQEESLKHQEQKSDIAIDAYLKKQEIKHDASFAEHLDGFKEKYDKFLSKADTRENIKSVFLIVIITLFAGVIGYNYTQANNTEKEMIRLENQMKELPSKKEVPTLNEIRMLRELGDQYNRDVFVRKEKVTADTSAYFWSKINIYGSTMRGGHEPYKLAFDSVVNENRSRR